MKDRESEALKFYSNSPHVRNITQLNFIDKIPKPEFEVMGRPTRTLNDFFDKDLIPTIQTIRSIYLPQEHHITEPILSEAIDWVNKNPDGLKLSSELPLRVLCFYRTLHFQPSFAPSNINKIEPVNNCPVAFDPADDSFKNDIHKTTLRIYDKLKYGAVYECKRVNSDDISTTLVLKMMARFSWGILDNKIDQIEPADLLTWEILKGYFAILRRRAIYLTGVSL